MKTAQPILLDASTLLARLFPDETSRPTVRWLRAMQARRLIPYYKLNGLVRFDLTEVQDALAKMRIKELA